MDYFSDNPPEWRRMDDTAIFLECVTTSGRQLDTTASVVREAPLPFYDRHRLVRIDHSVGDAGLTEKVFCLYDGKTTAWLDGTSSPIHAVNQDAPLRLKDEDVVTYLDFFCFFVRGEQGPFLLLQSLDGPLVPDGVADHRAAADGRTLRELFRRPRLFGRDGPGRWRCAALVYYSNAVFAADFLVAPGGMVEMAGDDPLLVGLPARVEAPLGQLPVKP